MLPPFSDEARPPPAGARRPTIGVLSDVIAANYYVGTIVDAIDETATAAGYDVVVAIAEDLAAGDLVDPKQRSLLRTIRPEWFDAVIVLSVGMLTSADELNAYSAKFSGLPVCSIAVPMPSFPSITVDGPPGLRQAVNHLVREHGKRRIAMIRGSARSTEHEERFRAYCAALEDNGIALDPTLVVPSNAYPPEGAEGVRVLLDERRADFDALMTVDDGVAIYAMRALRARSIRVPDDVAVVGFDDAPGARQAEPPLTTVRQPLAGLGRAAARAVLGALRGEPVPRAQILSTQLVVRRSCGCDSYLTDPDAARDAVARASLRPPSSTDLGASLRSDLRDGSSTFLSTLRSVLEQVHLRNGQERLTALRDELLTQLPEGSFRKLEDLIHAGRRVVAEADISAEADAYNRLYDWSLKLGDTSEALMTSLDMRTLMERFSSGLGQVGIDRCCVSVYEGDDRQPENARAILVHDADGSTALPEDGYPFRCAEQLLPPGQFAPGRRRTYIVQALRRRPDPLTRRSDALREELGYVVFEMGPRNGLVYQMLRNQISAALHGLWLWRRLFAERERREASERAYEKMASLGRLTAGIAHEMNTPVAAVRAAFDQMGGLVEEYRSSVRDPSVTPDDHAEIAREMHESVVHGDHAARRIADFVRTIRRQTRDDRKDEGHPFDPVGIIEDVLLLLEHTTRKTGCTVELVKPDQPLEIAGDPGCFRQVVSNLVTNGVEASVPKGGGPIRIAFDQDRDRIELIIEDRGEGILPENLGRIFDPMFTTRGFGDHSGLGLSIVHDIVTGAFAGSVRVESELGRGTRFIVAIPRSAAG